jgi:hypothetical protein
VPRPSSLGTSRRKERAGAQTGLRVSRFSTVNKRGIRNSEF